MRKCCFAGRSAWLTAGAALLYVFEYIGVPGFISRAHADTRGVVKDRNSSLRKQLKFQWKYINKKDKQKELPGRTTPAQGNH
jgi:hypothetical protein